MNNWLLDFCVAHHGQVATGKQKMSDIWFVTASDLNGNFIRAMSVRSWNQAQAEEARIRKAMHDAARYASVSG